MTKACPQNRESVSGVLYPDRWGQARVTRTTGALGDRVVKDYRRAGWLARLLWARLLARREAAALCALEGLPGLPYGVVFETPLVVSYNYIEGLPLRACEGRSLEYARVFNELLALVKAIHARGYVHLDTGNRGNVLIDTQGEPHLIDFASAIQTRCLPRFLARRLQRTDLMGVFKLWYRTAPDTMPRRLQRFFEKRYKKHIYSPQRLLNSFRRQELSTRYRLLPPSVLVLGLLAFLAYFVVTG